MLSGIVGSFAERCPNTGITALSSNPAETTKLHGIRAVNRMNPTEVISALRECDVLLSGGGSLLQDVTSIRSLLYYLSIIWVAKRLGKKVMVYAQGIGPLTKPSARRAVRSVLNKIDLISVRDTGSRDYLLELGVTVPEIVVTADPSFAVEPGPAEEADEILKAAGVPEGGKVLGVAIRPWLVQAHWLPELAQGIENAANKIGATPIFLPMQKDQDLGISVHVASQMKTPTSVVANQLSPAQTMAVIGKTSMLVGMRLHALIFSAILGVPFVGVAYDPKVAAFTNAAIGEEPISIENLTAAEVSARILDAWERREDISQKAVKHVNEFKDAALRNVDLVCELMKR